MPDDIHINAGNFQMPLGKLAEVLAQKLKREAVKHLEYVALDLHVLVRYAIWTYNLLFYLNAGERRDSDTNWRDAYTIVTLPLVRNLIDCLFNVTFILQDPGRKWASFPAGWFQEDANCHRRR